MIHEFIYPEIIREIREVCFRHNNGLASSEELQLFIQKGEGTIVAVEENDIRDFFTEIEGALELIKFIMSDEN